MEEYRINKAQEDGFKLGIGLAKKERILRKQQTRFYRCIQYWNAKTKRMIKKAMNKSKKSKKILLLATWDIGNHYCGFFYRKVYF